MNIRDFASQHRLVAKRSSEDDTDIILGKHGEIYEYSDQLFGVTFMPSGRESGRIWQNFRVRGVEEGMKTTQIGDAEGSMTFDPQNFKQTLLALKIAGVQRKRQLKPEQLERVRAMAARGRQAIAKARQD